MDPRYLNATEVLPPEVLEAVTKALRGRAAFLWVPGIRALRKADRDRYVCRLREEGLPITHIAMKTFLSERTIWRILAKERARSLPSAPGPGQSQRNPALRTVEDPDATP